MQTKTEEDNSMSERILNDIEHILYNDIHLKEFCIVPIDENKNKSPVLYEEHNLGLESWCVKYVYRYLYTELFKVRHLLKKNRLPQHQMQKLNKLLIGALLIHPDVSTFWNMRRELIEYGEINLEKELLLIKLVLSSKSKSNEAFAYRKWILSRLIKNVCREQINFATLLLDEEFSVTEMAAEKSQNNYHAWSHRIWCIQNIGSKNAFTESSEYLNIILNQLDFSIKWITWHISEHAGFHYRQYLCNSILHNNIRTTPHDIKYHYLIEPNVGITFSNCNDITYLNNLLGKPENPVNINNSQELLKCYNYVYYFIILLSDLFYFIESLNKIFPGHESIWYHRRYIVFHLLKIAYDYHGLTWKRVMKLNDLCALNFNDFNIINCNISDNMQENYEVQENGEKCPKLLKYEFDKVESSHLYKILVESETKFIRENSSDKCCSIQKELAKRHEKWLKFVLRFNRM